MGFWSSLAKIGTGLIPGVGGIAGSLIGGLIGGGGGGSTAQTDPLKNPEIQKLLQGLQTPTAAPAETTQAGNYYRTLLGGSQTETESMLAPEVSTITRQYDKAAQAAAELGPRGGGRTAQMTSLPFQKLQAYGDLLAKLKSGAPQGLQQIGAQRQQAQTARQGQYAGVLGSLLGQQGAMTRQQQQQQYESATGLGKGIGGLLTNVLSGIKFGRGDKSSAPFGTYTTTD